MFKSLDDVFNLYEICKFTAFSGRKDTLSCKGTRTQNHLIHKRTLNHLTKLAYWPNSWEFVYELNGSGFESSCSHLNFRFCACFEEGVPWHSGNYSVWIHSEMRMLHDDSIQSNLFVSLTFFGYETILNLLNF